MKSFYKFSLLVIFSAALLLQSCDDNSIVSLDFSEAPPSYDRSSAVSDTTLDENLQLFIMEEGNGSFEVVPNDRIIVQFTGRIQETGEIFESSYERRYSPNYSQQFNNLTPTTKTIQTIQGPRQVAPLVEGLRKGLLGMKEGEKRIIEVPPALGYSNSQVGTNGFDLRNRTLVYDVELVQIL